MELASGESQIDDGGAAVSSTHSDPIAVPVAEQAAAILYALASPVFLRWLKGHDFEPYQHWSTLRRIAAQILKRRSATIPEEEYKALIPAFKFAHDLAHDQDPAEPGPAESCHCPVAESMLDFALITYGCEAEFL